MTKIYIIAWKGNQSEFKILESKIIDIISKHKKFAIAFSVHSPEMIPTAIKNASIFNKSGNAQPSLKLMYAASPNPDYDFFDLFLKNNKGFSLVVVPFYAYHWFGKTEHDKDMKLFVKMLKNYSKEYDGIAFLARNLTEKNFERVLKEKNFDVELIY